MGLGNLGDSLGDLSNLNLDQLQQYLPNTDFPADVPRTFWDAPGDIYRAEQVRPSENGNLSLEKASGILLKPISSFENLPQPGAVFSIR
ncbi:MAG TPA: hypothetical protein VFY59_05090 [Rubrobacter sp.]|nr:hypothetical protein [Rubrobacter sp.]